VIQKYLEEFKRQSPAGIPWLDNLRKTSMERFEKTGFPTQRIEEWKDTNLTAITGHHFGIAEKKSKVTTASDKFWEKFPHVVFSNGFCESINIKTPGITVSKFSDAMKELQPVAKEMLNLKPSYDHSMFDLNTSMAKEGVFIQIQKNQILEEPIYLVYQADVADQSFHYRNLILSEGFSKANIVELFLSENNSWTNSVTQIETLEGASLEHIILNDGDLKSLHTGVVAGRLDKNSRLSTYSFVFGGKVVRNDIHLILDGEGAECVMDGLYAISKDQIVDHHTAVDHAKPHASSFENYRGVLMDDAHGIFQGKIFVAKDAQKTDAKQMNQNLLLSATAKVNTAPQLEILADDVKCAHGATIGKLDEDQVFYLRSRGIDLQTAKQMLVTAYADEVVSKISSEELQDIIRGKLSRKIGAI